MKANNIVWLLSFLLLCVSVLLLAGGLFAGVAMSDTLIRVLGITALVMLPIFVFASIRRKRDKS